MANKETIYRGMEELQIMQDCITNCCFFGRNFKTQKNKRKQSKSNYSREAQYKKRRVTLFSQ